MSIKSRLKPGLSFLSPYIKLTAHNARYVRSESSDGSLRKI